jgi:thioredoxin-like negative regulator of GroEL
LSDSSKYKDAINFCQVDVDELEDVTQDAGIRAMPTFQLYVDGQKQGELIGANKDSLVQLLDSNVGSSVPGEASASAKADESENAQQAAEGEQNAESESAAD